MDNEDTLRSALESAFDTVEGSQPTTEAAEPSDSESRAQRARDEAGRFAKNDVTDVTAKTDPVEQVQEIAQPQGKQAPSSWKKEAAAEFVKLAPHVQDEILRREGDFHKGIEGFKSHADAGRAYQKEMEPYQDTLKALGVDGVTAVRELMKADHILRHAPDSVKTQKILELAHVYGIDLQKQFSPEVAKYERELYDTRQQLRDFKAQQESASQQSLNSDIEAFKAAPGHEFFEELRGHMASLLSGGVAKDLEDAYQQAAFANPQTRTSLLEQQQKRAADEDRARRAKAASGSVRGSSPASGSTGAANSNSVRSAVEAAFDAHS